MSAKPKKRFDDNREELHAIAKEFAEKVKDNLGVVGIVAKPYGAYLHLITVVDWQIPREWEYKIYDAEAEIFDKYGDEVAFEFDTFDCLSPDRVDEVAYDDPGNIIYRCSITKHMRNPHGAKNTLMRREA